MKILEKIISLFVILAMTVGSYLVTKEPESHKLTYIFLLTGISIPVGISWANSFLSHSSTGKDKRFYCSWLRGAWTNKLMNFEALNKSSRQELAKELFDERYIAILCIILFVWMFEGEIPRMNSGGVTFKVLIGLCFSYTVIAITAKLIAGMYIIFNKEQ